MRSPFAGTAPPPEVQARIDARVNQIRATALALLADGPMPLRDVWNALCEIERDDALVSRALASLLSEKRTELDHLRVLRITD